MIHQLDKDAQIEVQNMQKQMFSIATVEKKKKKARTTNSSWKSQTWVKIWKASGFFSAYSMKYLSLKFKCFQDIGI